MDSDVSAMTGTIKTSLETATERATVLLTVRKVPMASANASTVTKKFSQMCAEDVTKTRFGSMATVSQHVESMSSTTQALKSASAYRAMVTTTMSVLSALETSSL